MYDHEASRQCECCQHTSDVDPTKYKAWRATQRLHHGVPEIDSMDCSKCGHIHPSWKQARERAAADDLAEAAIADLLNTFAGATDAVKDPKVVESYAAAHFGIRWIVLRYLEEHGLIAGRYIPTYPTKKGTLFRGCTDGVWNDWDHPPDHPGKLVP